MQLFAAAEAPIGIHAAVQPPVLRGILAACSMPDRGFPGTRNAVHVTKEYKHIFNIHRLGRVQEAH